MPQNFVECPREQVFLLPPDVRDWLPADHLVWLVLDAVGQLDLGGFYAAYRDDGHGRPAYDPAMVVALLLYAYSRGIRSSRVIERLCLEDIAFRVIAANERPDHSTIARFIVRHERALAEVFGGVLRVCAKAGLVSTGVVAVDGSKMAAAVSDERLLVDYEQIAGEILAEARAVDAAEDELYGERRGDELPPELATPEGRKGFLREAMRELGQQRPSEPPERQTTDAQGGEGIEDPEGGDGYPPFDYEPMERPLGASQQGRRGWLRDARRQLEQHRAEHPRPIPRSRKQRLLMGLMQLEEELDAERQATVAYAAWRGRGIAADGSRRMAPGTTRPYEMPDIPQGKVNIIDLDSRTLKTTKGYVQGYNAQIVTNEHQIVIAAEVTTEPGDFSHLEPMLQAAERELAAAGAESPGIAIADAGYWNHIQMQNIVNRGIQVLVPPDGSKRISHRPGWEGGNYQHMRRVLQTERGAALYRMRQKMIEPVFGNTKHNRGMGKFRRRGRSAARTELRLIKATHNVLKLHRHQLALATG